MRRRRRKKGTTVRSDAAGLPSSSRKAVLADHRRFGDVVPGADIPKSKVWVSIVLLIVAISVAYANSLGGPFIFDDGPSIVSNVSIRHLASTDVLVAPPDSVTTTGRPILNLSFAINYALSGLRVGSYHVVNLLIHTAAALVLFGLLRRTFLLPRLTGAFSQSSNGLALAISLLWALHPLQTESVTYIVQRAESLVGLFYLLTLYCYVRGVTADSRMARYWVAAAVASCGLGMGTKEVMVSAPLIAILYDRIFVGESFKHGWRQRKWTWLLLLSTWIVLLASIGVSGGRGGSAGFGLGMSGWAYLRTQFVCIIHYVRLCFWPHPLVLDYGNSVVGKDAQVAPYAVGVLVLIVATVIAIIRKPMLGFLGTTFWAILAPSSSIVPLAGQTEAEHRMYLPLASVIVLVVLAVHQMLRNRSAGLRNAMKPIVAVVVLVLAATTYKRNEAYGSELAIWDDSARGAPSNSRARLNRGNAFAAAEKYSQALEDYDEAARLEPTYPKVYNARGNALVAVGRYEDALRDYERAIKLKPDLPDAYNGRGSAHGHLGQVDAAIADFTKVIELSPTYAEAYFNRGSAFIAKGQPDSAMADLSRAIDLRPDYAEALSKRGSIYDNRGLRDQALSDYNKAIEANPDLAESYINRGGLLELRGRLDDALRDFNRAIILQRSPEAYSNRGNVFQAKGQYERAIKDYDSAIELAPEFIPAFQNRALAYYRIGAFEKARMDVAIVQRLGGTPIPGLLEDLAKASAQSP